MKESLITLAVSLAVLFLVALGNIALNDSQQAKCENRGGQYYRSLDLDKSFCAEPQKGVK